MRDRTCDIAVIGIFGRFPGCSSLTEWWNGIKSGRVCTTRYERQELLDAGVSKSVVDNPAYVPVRGHLDDANRFDNALFRISPRDAELMDPQHRLMLEAAWSALEDSGIGISGKLPITGVFASGSSSGYLRSLLSGRCLDHMVLEQVIHGTEPDFIASLISYKLDLNGPAIAVQTACSSSLVGVHLAVQALLNGDCDQALVVAAGIGFPQAGYFAIQGGIKSAMGKCRPFDKDADGVVEGSGVCCVVLRRLADAIQDGHDIYGVILGTAVNNDGASKVGYCAPSAVGQASVIKAALRAANVHASTIGYLEAHATGTRVGDPIEWSAATCAYREMGAEPGQIAVGALKANIGHLDAAAGLASLIKVLMILKNASIPPVAAFDRANPLLVTEDSPLFIPRIEGPWAGPKPRRAGISAFGVGGTNAHVIVEQATETMPVERDVRTQDRLVVLSAADPSALMRSMTRLRDNLDDRKPDIADVSFTLARRTSLLQRFSVAARTTGEVVQALERRLGNAQSSAAEDRACVCVFVFPGLGSQYPGMAAPFATILPAFRSALNHCLEGFECGLRRKLDEALFDCDFPDEELNTAIMAQPTLFAIEYATAVALIEIGIRPTALAGHNLGEITAACVAGVLDVRDGARLIETRTLVKEQHRDEGELIIGCSEVRACELLAACGIELCLSATGTSNQCVVTGKLKSLAAFEEYIRDACFSCRRRMMDEFDIGRIQPVLSATQAEFAGIEFRSPSIPLAMNCIGQLVMPGEKIDRAALNDQMNRPSRFRESLKVISERFPGAFALEVGPGTASSDIAKAVGLNPIPLLPRRRVHEDHTLLSALGELWTRGQPVEISTLCKPGRPIHLPTYPFVGPCWMASELAMRLQYCDGQSPRSTQVKDEAFNQCASSQSPYCDEDRRSLQVRAVLLSLWNDFLGTSRLTDDSDFFDLGGDSLLVVNLAHGIKQRLDIQVPLRDLLSARTLAQQITVVSELLARVSSPHTACSGQGQVH